MNEQEAQDRELAKGEPNAFTEENEVRMAAAESV